jgi:cardiolipin synthase
MRSLFLNLEMMLRVEDPAFAAAMHEYVDGEIAASIEITPEKHRAQRTFLNRIKWAIGYFLIAIADYRITRRLNFAGEAEPR